MTTRKDEVTFTFFSLHLQVVEDRRFGGWTVVDVRVRDEGRTPLL